MHFCSLPKLPAENPCCKISNRARTHFRNILLFFPDIPYLRELDFHANPLQKVEANAFEMVPQLVSLDLSQCGIKKIASKAFAQLGQLQKLYLNKNKLTELRQRSVETIQGEPLISGIYFA